MTATSDLSVLKSIRASQNGTAWTGLDKFEGNIDTRAVSPIMIEGYLHGILVVGDYVDDKFLREIGNIAGIQLSLASGELKPKNLDLISWKSNIKANSHSEPLLLDASFPSETIMAPFDSLKQSLMLFLFGVLVVASGLSMLFAISISKPISALVKAANLLRQGTWPAPFNSKANDEIGILMTSFDTMSKDLQAN